MTFRRPKAVARCRLSEQRLRTRAYKQGLRFRLAVTDMPGHPHLVFPKHKAALFVCSCFDFLHDCSMGRDRAALYGRRALASAAGNRKYLNAILFVLNARGWRTTVVWECRVEDVDPRELVTGIRTDVCEEAWLQPGSPAEACLD